MEMFSLGYALLSTQRALLRTITPELRAVVVDIDKSLSILYMRFYYNGAASEEHIDLWQCVITEASADFDARCELDCEVERLDYPQEIPFRGRYALLRKEPPLLTVSNLSIQLDPIEREFVDFQERIGLFVSPLEEKRIETRWGIIHYGKKGSHIVPAKPLIYDLDKIDSTLLSYLMLSIQRALLGVVTPELRTVIGDVNKETQQIYVRFYYDSNPSLETLEDWECAITEVLADFGAGYSLDAKVEKVIGLQKVPFRGRFAHLRKSGELKFVPIG